MRCTAPLSRVLVFTTECQGGMEPEWFKGGITEERSLGCGWGNERYVGIVRSSRRGKMSLIFELQIVQESEVGLYTIAKVREELRLMSRNGAREAVQGFKQQDNSETLRESQNNKDRVKQ